VGKTEAITKILELLNAAYEEMEIWVDATICAAQLEIIEELQEELEQCE
jgi:hypothetical protein